LNQDITTGLLVKQRSLHQREQVLELIFIKVLQKKHIKRANLSIVAAKYQLLKMQEDIALNVANAFLQVLLIRKT
jgi:outer membrane protein